MRQLTDRMTVTELQIEMEIQAVRERVSKLEALVRELSDRPVCACAHATSPEQ